MVAIAESVPIRLGAGTMVLVAVTVLAWASAFPAIRVALGDFGPVALGSGRFALAALPAALYLALARPPLPRRGEYWRFAVGGVFFVALYTVLLNIGELTVSAGAASFIINVAPIITAVLATLVLGERFPLLAWAGTAVSFAGIGLIALGEGDGLRVNAGALLIFGSALCAAVTTVVQKPLFARHAPLTVTAWNMVLGGICLLPALPAALQQSAGASAAGLLAILYLALVPGLFAYATWTTVLSRLPAARAINFMFAVPPTATLMGFLLLGEVPTRMGIVGGTLALAGVVLVNMRR